MKNRNKITRLFLLLFVLSICGGTVFAGGQQTADEERPITLTWMKHGSPSGIDNRSKLLFEVFPELAAKYRLEPVIAGPKSDDVLRKLRLGFAAGETPPDLVMLQYYQLKEFVRSGVLADVSDIYKPVWDDVPQAALDVVTVDGKQWGGVIQLKSKLWFYRDDLFNKAGIRVQDVITTSDVIAAGKKLQAAVPGSNIWNLGPNFASNAHYNFDMIISGNGGQLWSDARKEYVVDTDPGVRAAFEDLRKIYRAGITASIDDWTPDWEQGFADDTIASTMIAIWFRDHSYLPQWAPDQQGNWAVTTWPEIGGTKNGGGSQGGAGITVVPAASKHIEGAKEVLRSLLLTKEGSLAHYRLVPTSFPTFYPAINDPEVRKPDSYFGDSLYPAILKSFEVFKLAPTTPATAMEYSIMNEHLQEYVLGDISLDEILSRAKKELDTQIGNPWELF